MCIRLSCETESCEFCVSIDGDKITPELHRLAVVTDFVTNLLGQQVIKLTNWILYL